MSSSQLGPGWYHGEGDPPGTQRWWDGAQWVGEPVAVPSSPNPVGAHAAAGVVAGGTPRPETDNMIGWARLALSRWSDFSGRACRAEYWWFAVALAIAYVVSVVVFAALTALGDAGAAIGFILLVVLWLAAIVPNLSVAVRRLHDTGKSGWALLLGIIPLIGGILLLVWYATDSDPGPNRYGPPTK